ncbi:MAG: ThuA domain-containing protein [Planctomycetes bacterium]|nr:ThuA domain-containing protein [Planctomycetota bacterium]
MRPQRIRVASAALFFAAGSIAIAGEPMPAVDDAFEGLTRFEYGDSRRPLIVLEAYIAKSTGDPGARRRVADRLVAVASDPAATEAAKDFAFDQLRIAGTRAQVPALARMLYDPATAERSRMALQAIPGEEAGEALRRALGRLEGRSLIGVINALGARRDRRAVDALAGLAASAETETAAAAVRALGTIGSSEAAEALARCPDKPSLRAAVADAKLRCLEGLDADAYGRRGIDAAALSLEPSPAEIGERGLSDVSMPRSPERRKAIEGRAPAGFRLACYLDCGPDLADGGPEGPSLRLAAGQPHVWPGAAAAAEPCFGTIFFDGREVVFEAKGLRPEGAYRLGFSWWDFDHDTRVQSVWLASGGSDAYAKALDGAKLPSFAKRNEGAEEKTIEIPRDVYSRGAVKIAFRNEAVPNAVVSEIWLWEDEGSSAARPAPEKTGGASKRDAFRTTRVLLVTGVDYPGHPWRLTAPVVKEIIEEDPRLAVDVTEDPHALGTRDLSGYRAIVLHFMDWEVPAPGETARARLKAFVEGGGGLVLVHFACGAFQDWPEFRNLAGRAWDPKLRGHDPRGPFRVDIADDDHPITEGLASFETDDELYTCLAGDRPIRVLAKATSKVDGKDYPMAFVFDYGEGRVFHSPLGHDVKAFQAAGVHDLFRRGTAWAAKLPAAAKK